MEIIRIVATVLGENCYLVINQGRALVIDPGFGTAARVASVLADRQAKLGAVLLTHGHPDHVWDAAGVAGAAGGVPVYVPGPDRYRLADPLAHIRNRNLFPPLLEAWQEPANVQEVPAELFAAGGAQLIPGITLQALAAPGHTEGCTVFFGHDTVSDLGQDLGLEGTSPSRFMFSGDVIFAGAIGRTDLPGSDPAAMLSSLRTLIAATSPDTTILPGHGGTTRMDKEIQSNPFFP